MELLEKIVKRFKETPRKLTCGNSFCKVAASKAQGRQAAFFIQTQQKYAAIFPQQILSEAQYI